jgi:carbohydrate kinase (thermoresistant glucokinase family)
MTPPRRIVVMGVAGSGKSTVAASLAAGLGVPFVEGDLLHPAANVARMAAGTPLDDDDRRPWLAAVRRELRARDRVVAACSALRRGHRDALRAAGGVGFVHLAAGRDELERRLRERPGHFMGAEMLDGQLATLEEPGADETDVATVDGSGEPAAVLARVEAAVAKLSAGTATAPLLAAGGAAESISPVELRALAGELAETEVLGRGARRVLLVPPDRTRLQSRAGELAGLLFERLTAAGCEVAILPALGTHAPLTRADAALLFGDRVPFEAILVHRWREGLARLGEIGGAEISALSGGLTTAPIAVEVDEQLLDGWDLVVSIGQVVPHEVIGMANFTKNLVIGLGGAPTIDRTHFLGALVGIEAVLGRAQTPVRDVVDAAFDRFLAPRVPVLWLLTVVEDTAKGVVLRGLFAGRGRSGESGGAAFRAAAVLAAACDIEIVARPLERVACRLDPNELTTTWVGNKAVYRTRMAIADGGELIVLAPGVTRFGEGPVVDALIRRHGYRGTPAVLAALRDDPDLAANLGAAAHLIHGSSEGRFRIVYCTDPATGGLSRAEVEGVGYEWRPLGEELDRLGVGPETPSGPRRDRDREPFDYIANPALGLWSV